MKRVAIACVALSACVASADPSQAIGAGARASRDSDGLRMDREFASFFARYASEYDATRVAVEGGSYAQDDWRRHAEALVVEHRDLDRRTGEGLRLAVGLAAQGDRALVVGDLDWSRALRAGTRVGVVASRDWVETRRALEDGLHYDLAGASVDQEIGAGFTGVLFYARQRFSDGNARDHWRARLVHSLGTDSGVTMQLRYRGFASSREDVEGRYFNPARYHQVLAVLALRRRFEGGWRVNAEAGHGRQWIAGEASAPSWLATIGVDKAFDDTVVHARWGETRAASLGGPDYRYRWFSVDTEWRY